MFLLFNSYTYGLLGPIGKRPYMITFVLSWSHSYTLKALHKNHGMPKYNIWSYDRLFRTRHLPAGTWIFTDFDRLSPWDLELAAHVYMQLKNAGMHVLNNPAAILNRFDLLKTLHKQKINSFNVWRPYEFNAINNWPVFLRTETAHRGVLTDLLHNQDELKQALENALNQAYPRRDLMAVEYRAKALPSGVFRKYGAFRIGDSLFPAPAVHDPNWVAKYGQKGCASLEDYQEELVKVSQGLNEPILMQIFDIAGLQYGRIDYGIVDGHIETYEINSNPSFKSNHKPHPVKARQDTIDLINKYLAESFAKVDSNNGAAITIKDPLLKKQSYRDIKPGFNWLWRRSRWTI